MKPWVLPSSLLPLFLCVISGSSHVRAEEGPCKPERALKAVDRNLQELGRTPRSGHVTARVAGLYERIPSAETIEVDGYRLVTKKEDAGSMLLLETNVIDRDGNVVGFFSSVYDSRTQVWQMSNSDLALEANHPGPSFVRGAQVPEMVSGRGTPTQLFARLLQMRQAGISSHGAHSVRQLKTGVISNRRVLAELIEIPEIRQWMQLHSNAQGLRPGSQIGELEALVNRHIGETQTGRGMRDILTQAGFCVDASGFRVMHLKLSRPSPGGVHLHEDAAIARALQGALEEGIQIPSSFSVAVDVSGC